MLKNDKTFKNISVNLENVCNVEYYQSNQFYILWYETQEFFKYPIIYIIILSYIIYLYN